MSKKWGILVLSLFLLIPLVSGNASRVLAEEGIVETEEKVNENVSEIKEEEEKSEEVVEEETGEAKEEGKNNVDLNTSRVSLSEFRETGLMLGMPRSIGAVFTVNTTNGTGVNYKVLTEESITKTGTVEIGNGNKVGPNGYSTDTNGLSKYPIDGVLELPDFVTNGEYTYTVTKIGQYALNSAKINKISLPKTLTTIDHNSLKDNLFTSCTIPEGVTRIGDMAFANNGKMKVLKFPKTTSSLGSGIIQGCPALTTIYFPVLDAEFQADDSSRTNVSFYGFNSRDDGVIVVETKAQWDKWRLPSKIISESADITGLLIGLEVDAEFYDKNLKKLNIPSVKKLYGQRIGFSKGAEDQWTEPEGWQRCTDLPALPLASELGYTPQYWAVNEAGISTVDASGNIEESLGPGGSYGGYGNYFQLVDSKIVAVEEKLKPVVTGVDKKYDNKKSGVTFDINRKTGDKFLIKGLKYVFITLHAPQAMSGGYDFNEFSGNPTTLPVSIGHTESLESASKGFKNVADSGNYRYAMSFFDKETVVKNSGLIWMSNWGGSFNTITVKIEPADINIKPVVEKSEVNWDHQSELPEIKLSENDTEGTIMWDAGQTPKAGTHSYTYTFVPTNLFADGVAGKNIANYTEEKKTGAITITYKEDIKYDVKFYGMNNTLLKTQTVEAGQSAQAPTPPVLEGYEFVGWDKNFNEVNDNLIVHAVYRKWPVVVPEVTPTPPVQNQPTSGNISNGQNTKQDTKQDTNKKKINIAQDKKTNTVENKKMGVKAETINGDYIFAKNSKIIVEYTGKKDLKFAQKKLKNVIKTFDVILKEDGIRVEKTLESKVRVYLDAKEYVDYKDLKVYQKLANGKFVERKTKVGGEKIAFECDALGSYALMGVKQEESTSFPWWIVVAAIAVGGIFFIVYKRDKDSKE